MIKTNKKLILFIWNQLKINITKIRLVEILLYVKSIFLLKIIILTI